MNDAEPRPSITPGHHSSEGRNVVSGRDESGRDIFFAAVQMTRMPMVLCDPHRADCPIIFCNKAFCEMTGYAEADILGQNCRFLQGPATDVATVERIRRGLAERRDIQEELFNYRKNGEGFWNALFISPVFDGQGELLYQFGSQIDVTKRKEAEFMLAQSRHMEALGAMASGVAHEFNNLMTIVIASIEQAAARPSDAKQSTQLERADWGARRAGRLTQQILSFARRQLLEEQPVDINEVLGGIDAVLMQVAGDQIGVEFKLSPSPVVVLTDPGQLELALIAIVRNARDAMEQGGEITVTTRILDDGTPEIVVRDTGHGMSGDVLRRAADPFFTTKPPGAGAGLGLSMVHGFLAQTGGHLTIESESGRGASVAMRFRGCAEASLPEEPVRVRSGGLSRRSDRPSN